MKLARAAFGALFAIGCQTLLSVEPTAGSAMPPSEAGSEDAGVDSGAEADVLDAEPPLTYELLAKSEGTPGEIALNGTHLYWIKVDRAGIGIWPKNGGDAGGFPTGRIPASGIVADGLAVFWAMPTAGSCEDGIMRAAPNGWSPTRVLYCKESVNTIHALASDATSIYWATSQPNVAVFLVSKEGALDGTLLVGGTTLAETAGALAVSDDAVFWTQPQTGTIERFDKATKATSRVASEQPGVSALVAKSKFVYFARGGSVFRVSENGGSAQELATGEPAIGGLAVEDLHVYWTRPEAGVIQRAPFVRGDVQTLIENQPGVRAIAVDGSGVYFARDSGEIARLRR